MPTPVTRPRKPSPAHTYDTMTKIIIIGHPQSDIEGIEHMLLTAGMASAQPSRRDGLKPQEISATLIKAHGAVPVESLQTAEQLQQIQPAPVWQGMALDLMLGNLEQPLWGWADPQAVYLLDYWKNLGPKVVFVLVYDAPHTSLTRLSLEDAAASEQELQRRLDAWVAYNSALLHFHLSNPACSVLVHAGQVKSLAKPYLQHLSERIALPLELPAQEVPLPAIAEPDTASAALEDAQVEVLIGLLMQENPEAQALYAQLQAATTLSPALQAQALVSPATAPASVNIRYRAWQACVTQQQQIQHLSQRIREMSAQDIRLQEQIERAQQKLESAYQQADRHAKNEYQLRLARQTAQAQLDEYARQQADFQGQVQKNEQEKDLLQSRLSNIQKDLEHYRQENQKLVAKVKSSDSELQIKIQQIVALQDELKRQSELLQQAQANEQKGKGKNIELQQENDLLLAQLQQVQEELERHFLKAQEQAAAVATAKSELQAKNKQLAAIQTELNQENDLLLAQLHKVQEGLENYYIENQTLKANQKPTGEIYHGAADRVRGELPYRLGARMLAQPRTLWGWLKMPFAIRAEVKHFYQSGAADEFDSLPPIYQYADAHEAEEVKNDLSYRLGSVLLTCSRSLFLGWLRMPNTLRAELKSVQKQRD